MTRKRAWEIGGALLLSGALALVVLLYMQRRAATAALLQAVANHDLSGVRQTLGCGADANGCNSEGNTALILACWDRQTAIGELLLAHGARVDARAHEPRRWVGSGHDPPWSTWEGKTPLLLAVEAEDSRLVRSILEKGADPNATNAGGQTPLLEAAERIQAEMVGLLLNHGADPNHRRTTSGTLIWPRSDSTTPLIEAVHGWPPDGPGQLRAVQLLLAAGADPNAKDINGWSCVRLATAMPAPATARLLKQHGAR
jgi:ankyrin repeat protein